MTSLRVENVRSHAVGVDGSGDRAVAPASFTVGAGECVCISGASGTGKTLLLRAIADLDPAEGQVFLGDKEHYQFSGPEWRRYVGFLPTESAWWDDRIRAHFPGRRAKYLEVLGFDLAILGRWVARLSTGERQRLALLRLLNRSPQALLLDEPTGSLDPANAKRVEALIAKYRKEHGASVLWVSHDPRQIKRVCNRHLRFQNGKLNPVKAAPKKTIPKRKKAAGR